MIVYVDVDDTLVRSVGSKRIPIPDVIAHVRRLKQDGVTLYCWSAGGADYARDSAAEVGLSGVFEAFLPKPRVMIDDQRIEQWPFCVTVHPT
jgi:predicted HAD superfamily phosphohydrolase YqeG